MRSAAAPLALLIALALALAPALAAKLPSYIKACRRNDPKLNECAVRNGQEAIPKLVNGDSKLGIPKLDPLEIDRVVVGDSKSGRGLGIEFTCNKCKISGLRGVKLEQDSSVDLKRKRLELRATIPTLSIKGKYSAEGKVMILPIKGDGDADITLGDLKIAYITEFELKKGKDGKDHLRLKNPKLDFKANQFKIRLTNLFNGDKTLGDQMNVFLNENWREVLKEFGPAVGETVSQIVYLIVNSIAEKVPYDDIFLK